MSDPTPLVVMLPGLACDATMWRAQSQALSPRYRTAVTDAHARFDSIEAMAAGLLAEHEGDLILCGASMGSMLALEAARQAPERVKAVALLGSNARPESEDMRALRLAAIVLFEQGRVEEVLRANVSFAFHPGRVGEAALIQSYMDLILRSGAAQLIAQNRALMARPDARLHLPRLRCPLLLICGDADQLTPLECSREIASLVPQAELHVIEECGHMLTMERPDQVNALLLHWLGRIA